MAAPGPRQMLLQAMILLFEDRTDEFKAAVFSAIHNMKEDMAAWLLLQPEGLKRATINRLVREGGWVARDTPIRGRSRWRCLGGSRLASSGLLGHARVWDLGEGCNEHEQ